MTNKNGKTLRHFWARFLLSLVTDVKEALTQAMVLMAAAGTSFWNSKCGTTNPCFMRKVCKSAFCICLYGGKQMEIKSKGLCRDVFFCVQKPLVQVCYPVAIPEQSAEPVGMG